ncbi:MAG TPA: response regulator transcription factor [Candidatus Pelethocola excrementipullorum]|nr:response regulator transcription factor [Candidatus Pelethocola excrementipullorum]
MEKILIIEDDLDINQLLQRILKKEGYEVVSAYSGTEGELRLSMEEFDLMLCDLVLPGMSGEDLIKKVRKDKTFPIIALTSKSGLEDKVQVLGLGADDYVTKPFEQPELLARVNAQLRRMKLMSGKAKEEQGEEACDLTFRDIVLSPESMDVMVKGEKLELTAHEFEILKTMLETPKKVFSKESLYESVWKNGYYGEDNTISVHISNIRKKIARITSEEYIGTVWGIGYKLNL